MAGSSERQAAASGRSRAGDRASLFSCLPQIFPTFKLRRGDGRVPHRVILRHKASTFLTMILPRQCIPGPTSTSRTSCLRSRSSHRNPGNPRHASPRCFGLPKDPLAPALPSNFLSFCQHEAGRRGGDSDVDKHSAMRYIPPRSAHLGLVDPGQMLLAPILSHLIGCALDMSFVDKENPCDCHSRRAITFTCRRAIA